jgi:hypothetical protein
MLVHINLDSYNSVFSFSNEIKQDSSRFERFLPVIIRNELYMGDHALISKYGRVQVLHVDLFDERNCQVGSIYVMGRAGVSELKETVEKYAKAFGLHLNPYTFDEFEYLTAHPERAFQPERLKQIVL